MSRAPGARPSGGWLSRHLKAGLAVAVALGLVVTAALRVGPPPAQGLAPTPVVLAVLNDPGSPALGDPSADVTIVLFTDYQCPICRSTDGALEAARRADPHVRVVYKDWPILGGAVTPPASRSPRSCRHAMARRTPSLDRALLPRMGVKAGRTGFLAAE